MTVFNDALRVIFDDTNIAVAATYSPPGGGAPVSCRVITRHGDRAVALGESRPIGESMAIEGLAADLTPLRGGVFSIGATSYTIAGDPIREDADRAIWTCTVR